jgi:hypothetical protein
MKFVKVEYRNLIDAALLILPSEVETFDRKRHSRTRPESKRQRRKVAHESRRVNR